MQMPHGARGIESPETRVTGGYEPLGMGSGMILTAEMRL